MRHFFFATSWYLKFFAVKNIEVSYPNGQGVARAPATSSKSMSLPHQHGAAKGELYAKTPMDTLIVLALEAACAGREWSHNGANLLFDPRSHE